MQALPKQNSLPSLLVTLGPFPVALAPEWWSYLQIFGSSGVQRPAYLGISHKYEDGLNSNQGKVVASENWATGEGS